MITTFTTEVSGEPGPGHSVELIGCEVDLGELLGGDLDAALVEILSVAAANGRQELIATCQRGGQRHHIALLDIHVNSDQPASRLLAAYHHWTGAETPRT